MPLHRLSSIALGVPCVEAVCGFYAELGLTQTRPGHFETLDGGEQLQIAWAPQRRLLALCAAVDDEDDLARARAALAALGIASHREEGGLDAVEPVTSIRVRLEITPRQPQQPVAPLATNAPGRALRVDARSAAVLPASAPRPRRLGHVVIGSTDARASRRFFVEGLGFRVSDQVPALDASFLRCSTDHHNLLVQPAPLAFVHHTAWEMDDVDAVGHAAAEMVAADPSRHVWGLGRHGIGSNYFWYLRDPAGNFCEYISDLDVIVDEEAWKISASTAAHPLAAWGPPVPASFLAPDDVAALARGD